MNRNRHCWKLLQFAFLILTNPFCTASDDINICQHPGDTVNATFRGFIVSPTVTAPEPLQCRLMFGGIPAQSWFGLYAETLKLPCTQRYNCSQYGYSCDTGKSSITINKSNGQICQSYSTHLYLYHYKNYPSPLLLEFQSDYFLREYSFRLQYRVASVIDIGEDAPLHAVDTTGQQSGYVVSHSAYGNEYYRGNINSTLTLRNLRSNRLVINFQNLKLSGCSDYLVIYGLTATKICGYQKSQYKNTLNTFKTRGNHISFQFVTTEWAHWRGFRFMYEVLDPPSPTTTTSLKVTTDYTSVKAGETIESAVTMAHAETTTTAAVSPPNETTEDFSATPASIKVMESTESTLSSSSSSIMIQLSSTTREYSALTLSTPSSVMFSQSDGDQADALNHASTTSPPDGSTVYIGVGIGGGVLLAVVMVIIILVLRKRRNSQDERKDQTKGESGNQIKPIAANNAYELTEIDETYYSSAADGGADGGTDGDADGRADEGADGEFLSGDQSNASQAKPHLYSFIDKPKEQDKTNNSSELADAEETYYSVVGVRNADLPTAEISTNEETPSATYILADDQAELPPETSADEPNIYQLAEEVEEDYTNATAVKRFEDEREMQDEYASVNAATKSKKEVTELIENDLYGT